MLRTLAAAYRRTGADLPGSDPRPTHHAEMEGWYWRFTDVARRRVVIALCGINRHPGGDWATVAVAAHPGGLVRSAAVPGARASAAAYKVAAGDVLRADARTLRADLDDVHLAVDLGDAAGWPLRLGGGGVLSAVPFLGQYWHPHVLGGQVAGRLTVDRASWTLDGAVVYAEKNWGAGFPQWWWWGQAQGFADPSLCVAFGGGRLTAGPVGADVTGCVIRSSDRVLRFSPPASHVSAAVHADTWRVEARKPGWRAEIEGTGRGAAPAVLPVPVPAERRNVKRDLQHLAGHLRLRVWRGRSLVVDDETDLAALEVGSTDERRAAALARGYGLTDEVD